MKKLINLLKGSTFVLALCGLMSVACFSFERKATKTDAVSTSINLDNYQNYEFSNGLNYYWDGTFIAYDNLGTQPTNNSSSLRSLQRVNNDTINDLTGLYFDFNLYLPIFNSGSRLNVDFYSYYKDSNNNILFDKFKAIVLSGNNVQFSLASDNTLINVAFANSYPTNATWYTDYSRNVLFVSQGVPNSNQDSLSNWITRLRDRGTFYYFYEMSSYISQVTTLTSQIVDLNDEIDNLEDQVETLEGDVSELESQISDLESQVTTLESQVSTLTNQLRNAYIDAREDTYVIDIKCEYKLRCGAFINFSSGFDYYIVPRKMTVVSSLEVSDCRGNPIESHFNVVDELDLSELSNTVYYYNGTDLNTLLFVELNDDWLLDIPYYVNNNIYYFDLTNLNYYLQDWVLSYKSDISFTGNDVFRNMTFDYLYLTSNFLDYATGNYEFGFDDGYVSGYNDGRIDGFSQGESYGYNEGLGQDTAVASIFSGILQVALVPVNFFLAIFNFEILGINLSGFIRALFTVAITVIILRVVLGGKGSDS